MQMHPGATFCGTAAIAGQEKYEEAEQMLVGAAEKLKDDATAPLPRRRQAIQRVIDLYDAWNRPEQAAAWREMLDAFNSTNK